MTITDEEQQERRQAIRNFITQSPYIKDLNMSVDEWSEERVVMRLPFEHRLSNDGRAFHGGVVSALIDTAGACAVWAGHDFNKGMKAATVAMSLNYLGAAYQCDLLAEARCVKRGKELAFSEVFVRDPEGKPVASAIHTYRIVT